MWKFLFPCVFLYKVGTIFFLFLVLMDRIFEFLWLYEWVTWQNMAVGRVHLSIPFLMSILLSCDVNFCFDWLTAGGVQVELFKSCQLYLSPSRNGDNDKRRHCQFSPMENFWCFSLKMSSFHIYIFLETIQIIKYEYKDYMQNFYDTFFWIQTMLLPFPKCREKACKMGACSWVAVNSIEPSHTA